MEGRVRKNVTTYTEREEGSGARGLFRARIDATTRVLNRLAFDSSIDTTTISSTTFFATFASYCNSWLTFDLSIYAFQC
ncbi:50S ribosomal protein L11 [Bienertia sinuspersici]